jgi:hypothetical protein
MGAGAGERGVEKCRMTNHELGRGRGFAGLVVARSASVSCACFFIREYIAPSRVAKQISLVSGFLSWEGFAGRLPQSKSRTTMAAREPRGRIFISKAVIARNLLFTVRRRKRIRRRTGREVRRSGGSEGPKKDERRGKKEETAGRSCSGGQVAGAETRSARYVCARLLVREAGSEKQKGSVLNGAYLSRLLDDFRRAIAVPRHDHFSAWLCQQMIVFCPTLFCARFGAAWA